MASPFHRGRETFRIWKKTAPDSMPGMNGVTQGKRDRDQQTLGTGSPIGGSMKRSPPTDVSMMT